MNKTIFLFVAWFFLNQETNAQQSPPLREENVIKSKLFFTEKDLEEGTAFVENFKNAFGVTEEKFEKHRIVSDKISSKEKELTEKKNKTGQEKTFIKMIPCLKELMSVKYKSTGWDADNLGDCYQKHKVNPNIFHQSVDGKLLYNKTQIHQAGDELSKLIDLIEDNTPTKDTPEMFRKYLNAVDEKKKWVSGGIDKLKQKVNYYQQEYVYRKKIQFKVDMNLKKACAPESIPDLGKFEELYTDNSLTTTMDMLKSLTKNLDLSIQVQDTMKNKDVCTSLDSILIAGFLNDVKKNDDDEKCKEAPTGLEKIIQVSQENKNGQENEKKIKEISCLLTPKSNFLSANENQDGLKKLKEMVYLNLIQGLGLGAKMANSYSLVVGIKEKNGICGYVIRDHSKKALIWIREQDFLDQLQDISTFKRDTRPEDMME